MPGRGEAGLGRRVGGDGDGPISLLDDCEGEGRPSRGPSLSSILGQEGNSMAQLFNFCDFLDHLGNNQQKCTYVHF